MKVRRHLGRAANRALKTLNLEISPIALDFDARLLSPKHVDRFVESLSTALESWLESQSTWPASHPFDAKSTVVEFCHDYLKSPFRNPKGGSRFGNLLWLTALAKLAKPDVIVDSGTYTGASAWALSRGAPNARTLSFDIDLSRLVMRVPGVTYIEADWTTLPRETFASGKVMAYFDDHLDQGRRLREAHDRGIPLTVFDDDYSVLNFAGMAHGGAALPKISFILDETLTDREVIEWAVGTEKFRWTVDKSRLDGLRQLIARSERLPNIAADIGFEQLPYRIVQIAH